MALFKGAVSGNLNSLCELQSIFWIVGPYIVRMNIGYYMGVSKNHGPYNADPKQPYRSRLKGRPTTPFKGASVCRIAETDMYLHLLHLYLHLYLYLCLYPL